MTTASAADELQRLLEIMRALRDPVSGCPWDREQSFASIAPYTIEEAYEVADAVGRPGGGDLADELGDLLLQVVYHAQLAEEAGWFDFAAVARAISDKMVRRHPHVFGGSAAETGLQPRVVDAGLLPQVWDSQKSRERAARAEFGTLAGIPVGLPALTRAAKLTKRAARVGFDWPDAGAVLAKLDEEVAELQAELPQEDRVADPARLQDEVGDMLFVLANLARKLDLDPEACLRHANDKFTRRFGGVERRLAAEGRTPADTTLEAMEAAWRAEKTHET